MATLSKKSSTKTTRKPKSVKEGIATEPIVNTFTHNYEIHKHLQSNFGFEQFKGLQEDAINSLLNGKDTFVIMPTGGGKSFATSCRHYS